MLARPPQAEAYLQNAFPMLRREGKDKVVTAPQEPFPQKKSPSRVTKGIEIPVIVLQLYHSQKNLPTHVEYIVIVPVGTFELKYALK
jgi:hypothetical protein